MNFFILFVAMSVVCLTTSIQSVVRCPDGTELKGGICTPCSDRMFRNGNMSKCMTFQLCDNDPLVIGFRGNSTHDAVCRCDDPKFPIVYGNICVRDTNCPAGTYLSGVSCVDCLNGTFKNTTGPSECLLCTECNETLHECKSTMDAICAKSAVVYGGSTVAEGGNFSTGAIAVIIIASVFIVMVIIVLVVKRKDICPTKQKSPSVEGGPIRNHEDPEPTTPLRSINADGASNNHESS